MAFTVVVKRYTTSNQLIGARVVIRPSSAYNGVTNSGAEYTFTVPYQSGEYTIELHNPSSSKIHSPLKYSFLITLISFNNSFFSKSLIL